MRLQGKVIELKMNAAKAWRQASWWENLIKEHGEHKATEFYKHLGLNHLEKSIEWEGLTLSREPKEHEKLCIKGIAQAQESAKESIGKILLSLRLELISDGLEGIGELTPATYHTLVLETPAQSRSDLRDRLSKVYQQGRNLVTTELSRIKQDDDGEENEEEPEELDTLADVTDGRVVNDVQSRLIAAAQRFVLLGLVGAALLAAIQKELADGSVSYIDRAAVGVGNKVIAIGRMDEMRSRSSEIDRYEQSEILDNNTCSPCAEDDGKTASDPDDLPGAPNPNCEGGDYCRGFIVAISL